MVRESFVLKFEMVEWKRLFVVKRHHQRAAALWNDGRKGRKFCIHFQQSRFQHGEFFRIGYFGIHSRTTNHGSIIKFPNTQIQLKTNFVQFREECATWFWVTTKGTSQDVQTTFPGDVNVFSLLKNSMGE